MPVQPQLLLLQKTLLYVEGLGRQLYPQLDLWKTAKPFLEAWMQEQMGWSACWRRLKERTPLWLEQLPQLPDLLQKTLAHQETLQQCLLQQQQSLQCHQQREASVCYWSYLGASLFLGSMLLLMAQLVYWRYLALASALAWWRGWRLSRTVTK